MDDEEPDDDEKDEDDDSQPSDILRQRGFNFNKYKRFDLNQNLRDDDDLDEDVEDEFEKFNELKNAEDRNAEENSSDPFEDRDSSEESSSSEESIEEYEESDENMLKEEQDQQLNNSANNQENDIENSKLLSPFMAKNFEANMSPTSSSDIIFNELSMQANQLDEQEKEEAENEIQLAKLKKAASDSMTTNNSNLISSNSLDASSGTLPIQGRGGSRGGSRGGGRGNKRNLFDHWILIRKRRQINRSSQKKGSSRSKSGFRNFY